MLYKLVYNMFNVNLLTFDNQAIYNAEYKFSSLGLTLPGNNVMYSIIELHNFIMLILLGIVYFTLAMIFEIIIKFTFFKNISAIDAFKKNRLLYNITITHHTFLEFMWTLIPTLILIIIAIPSFAFLYAMDTPIHCPMTLHVIAHQWYWTYDVIVGCNFFDYIHRRCLEGEPRRCVLTFQRAFKYAHLIWDCELNGYVDSVISYKNLIKYHNSFKIGHKNLSFIDKYRIASYKKPFKLKYMNQLNEENSFKYFFYLLTDNRIKPYNLSKLSFWIDSKSTKYTYVDDYSKDYLGYLKKYAAHCKLDSYMIPDNELLTYGLSKNDRLLRTDNPLVLPGGTYIKALITSDDVLHSFAVPSLGIKMDAVPGRLNQVTFIMNRHGSFWGQCSELCGANHGFMPIEIWSVNNLNFEIWYRLNSSDLQSYEFFLDSILSIEVWSPITSIEFYLSNKNTSLLKTRFTIKKFSFTAHDLKVISQKKRIFKTHRFGFHRLPFWKMLQGIRYAEDEVRKKFREAALEAAKHV